MTVTFEFREMTDTEYKREQDAFDEHSEEYDNPPEKQERLGFVAIENDKFVGASSGLALKDNNEYGNYFKLTDLLVEKEYRKQGYGKKLLELLENKLKELVIGHIWTWTAEYEAKTFYLKQSYQVFAKFDNFYFSGHSRVGLMNKLN